MYLYYFLYSRLILLLISESIIICLRILGAGWILIRIVGGSSIPAGPRLNISSGSSKFNLGITCDVEFHFLVLVSRNAQRSVVSFSNFLLQFSYFFRIFLATSVQFNFQLSLSFKILIQLVHNIFALRDIFVLIHSVCFHDAVGENDPFVVIDLQFFVLFSFVIFAG